MADAAPTKLSPGSSVPAWLSDILPAWFTARPAFTEALWAASYSLYLSLNTIFWTAFGLSAAAVGMNSFGAMFGWIAAHWQGVVIGFVLGGGGGATARGFQAFSKAKSA